MTLLGRMYFESFAEHILFFSFETKPPFSLPKLFGKFFLLIIILKKVFFFKDGKKGRKKEESLPTSQ